MIRADGPPPPIVDAPAGRIEGRIAADGRTVSFKGIPYARPPVGERRWRAPQPVPRWDGTLVADRYGPACPQPLHARDQIMRQFGFADVPETGQSEDCLNLNVWAPADATDAAPCPVIVWLYGGGHRVGSGSHPVSDGTALAAKGAVVVSFNYRLGALGYLAHPALTAEAGASGHYALLDDIAVLGWVRDNIAAFGGDPGNVTLFGQSAGAAHITALMAIPAARGLFHKVIATGGGRFAGGPMGQYKTLAEAEAEGAALMEKLGARTADEMRALPPDQLFVPRGSVNLILDGELLTRPAQAAFDAGEAARVPVLAGFAAEEAAFMPLPELRGREALTRHLGGRFGDAAAAAILALYGVEDDAGAARASDHFRRDLAFGYQAWRFAEEAAGQDCPAWLFVLHRAVPLPAGHRFAEAPQAEGYGAYHGSELWYLFNTLTAQPWDWSDDDRAIADAMTSYLVAFARTGDPNVAGLPAWPGYRGSNKPALSVDRTIHAEPMFNAAGVEFFHSLKRPA